MVTDVPAEGDVLLVETMYFAAGPATVVTFPLVPVRLLASVAVKAYVILATVLVVNDTVAIPFASVEDVGDANEPPAPVLLHVTVMPDVVTGLPLASVSCAVTVTGAPAATLEALVVTMYFAAPPTGGPDVITGEVPVTPPVVAVTVCCAPGVALAVKITVATPLEFVVLVPVANEPPPLLVHVTV
jgi:hypothetical protein